MFFELWKKTANFHAEFCYACFLKFRFSISFSSEKGGLAAWYVKPGVSLERHKIILQYIKLLHLFAIFSKLAHSFYEMLL